ncbi:homeobox-leucine zipper protein ROC3-like [Malus sylvestris]|uniref:homeobox-leucine zipper protein ROC3-like n=1 Tax=Malus sylvestris TaxID=3752 RepID=UPI0021ACC8F6|nr:homeobox-leucine zipper protein ROC3-like [Malus sylvestris]
MAIRLSYPRYAQWILKGYMDRTCRNRGEVCPSNIQSLCLQWDGIWSATMACSLTKAMFASLMARNKSDLRVIPSPEARKNMMKLSQRMLRTVCVNMSTSNGQSWTDLSDSPDDTVRITTRKVTDPGQPIGVILTAVSTTWLPYSHYCVFELLREERRRAQPDVLTNGNSLHEVARIANGSSWKLHFSFSHK